jgi:hypothetical protein
MVITDQWNSRKINKIIIFKNINNYVLVILLQKLIIVLSKTELRITNAILFKINNNGIILNSILLINLHIQINNIDIDQKYNA